MDERPDMSSEASVIAAVQRYLAGHGCEVEVGAELSKVTMSLTLGGCAAGSGCSSHPATLAMATNTPSTPPQTPRDVSADAEFAPLEVILLGTQGAPVPDRYRTGISSALVVDGAVYVIDCGRSSLTNYLSVGLQLKKLDSIFLTHLHSDHLADYYNYFLIGSAHDYVTNDALPGPIPVYGPGSPGALPPPDPGGSGQTVDSADPVPGMKATTHDLNDAYAYSDNIFFRDSDFRNVTTLAQVHEIALPADANALTDRYPTMAPIPIMEDSRVKVTAILVDHGLCYPAFAFRFDTDHGSVAFSGDTTVCDNFVTLAKGADLIVHEAIGDPSSLSPILQEHMQTSHTMVSQIGGIAQRCETPAVALTHLIEFGKPVNVAEWEREAKNGYDGRVVVGQDRMRIPIRVRTQL